MTRKQLQDQIYKQDANLFTTSLYNQVHDQVHHQIWDQVWRHTDIQVHRLWVQTWAQVRYPL